MKYIIFTFLFFLVTLLPAQSITWIDFADLRDSLRHQPKPVLVFLTADWCPYCKLQDRKTFTKKKVIQDLEDVYCLRLNVESREEIEFLNRNYRFEPTGANTGTHGLAKLLGTIDGRLLLPTTVLLNEQLQIVRREKGYMDPIFFRRFLKR